MARVAGWNAEKCVELVARTAGALREAAAAAAALGGDVATIHASAAFGLCVLAESLDATSAKHGWPVESVRIHTAEWRRAANAFDHATCRRQCDDPDASCPGRGANSPAVDPEAAATTR